MAAYSGFLQESYDSVFITLDKMDKIGPEGVKQELIQSGFQSGSAGEIHGAFSENGTGG